MGDNVAAQRFRYPDLDRLCELWMYSPSADLGLPDHVRETIAWAFDQIVEARDELAEARKEWERFALAVGLADGDQGRYVYATVDEAINEIKRAQSEHLADIDELAAVKDESAETCRKLLEDNHRIEAELADWQNTAEQAAGEMCGDEKHCVCVPALRVLLTQERERIASLKIELAEAHGLLNSEECDAIFWKERCQKFQAELAEARESTGRLEVKLFEQQSTNRKLEAENAALREYVEIITDGGTDYPETWDELHRLGLIVEVKPTPEFTDEWGDDVAMWVLAWKAGGFEAIDAASKS